MFTVVVIEPMVKHKIPVTRCYNVLAFMLFNVMFRMFKIMAVWGLSIFSIRYSFSIAGMDMII